MKCQQKNRGARTSYKRRGVHARISPTDAHWRPVCACVWVCADVASVCWGRIRWWFGASAGDLMGWRVRVAFVLVSFFPLFFSFVEYKFCCRWCATLFRFSTRRRLLLLILAVAVCWHDWLGTHTDRLLMLFRSRPTFHSNVIALR